MFVFTNGNFFKNIFPVVVLWILMNMWKFFLHYIVFIYSLSKNLLLSRIRLEKYMIYFLRHLTTIRATMFADKLTVLNKFWKTFSGHISSATAIMYSLIISPSMNDFVHFSVSRAGQSCRLFFTVDFVHRRLPRFRSSLQSLNFRLVNLQYILSYLEKWSFHNGVKYYILIIRFSYTV